MINPGSGCQSKGSHPWENHEKEMYSMFGRKRIKRILSSEKRVIWI